MTCRCFIFTGIALLCAATATIAAQYQSNSDLATELKDLQRRHSEVVNVTSVAKSRAQHDVWLVRLGRGESKQVEQRPAMLVVAGIEGNDLAGTFFTVAWAKRLVAQAQTDEKVRRVLDTKTIYLFPRVNPDAADAFFRRPQVERSVSTLPVDEDHDGFLDEDGPDDLNNDGLITWMRVQDPEGEYIIDPAEPRLLLKADRARGEIGRWRYLVEGRDNDGDEAWNEDALGGVNLNRNFPHNYRFFAGQTGTHQVSETETRVLADFIVSHPDIAIVFTFGAADNLTQAPKAEAAGANRRPQTDLQPDDLPIYRELGKQWRETIGLKKELPTVSEPGTFSDWMYFHRGRLSLAARAWTTALQIELDKDGRKKEEKKDEEKPKEEKKDQNKPDTRNDEERAALKWFDENAKEAFIPWRRMEHPDFSGKTVEIGGYAPFARSNPPERLLESLAEKHAAFLTDLAGKFPELQVRQAKVENLGEGVFDVTLQIENTGYLPTALTQGNVTREVLPTRVTINLEHKAILSGSKRATIPLIEGSGGMRETRWVIHAPKAQDVTVTVWSLFGGTLERKIELK